MNLAGLLTNAATNYPDQVSFIFEGQARTYAESLWRSDAVAASLSALGVRAGDRVALYQGNSPEYLEIMFAVWKIGAVVVPLNATFTVDELVWHLGDSGAVVAFVDAECASRMTAARSHSPQLKVVVGLGTCPEADHELAALVDQARGVVVSPYAVEPEDLAWLAYTSGTTGRPKGAMLSHGAMLFQVLSTLADVERLERDHVGMHAAPLSHGAGHNALVMTTKACTQLIHQRAGFDPVLFMKQVQMYQVGAVFLVPTQIKLIVDHPDVHRYDLSSLRWVMYGGSPMYRADQKTALRILGPVLVQIFGQTESPMSGTVLSSAEHSLEDDPQAMSVGRVRNGLELRIFDEQGAPVATGEPGEICIRGATLMSGYWNRPDATAETLRDGWLHTGDVGVMDERGYLYIQDRLKDMVISGGLNVYPREVEDVLLTHPGVDEACVIGIPDAKWGEAVHAVVVPVTGHPVNERELIEFAGLQLAPYKKPKAVEFVESLPKTAYGKVAKREVRARYWAAAGRAV
jgi:acyl-CoA synthetase (AMP-forming)/AMP-acid ligase II